MTARRNRGILAIGAATALVVALFPAAVLAAGHRMSGTVTDMAGTPLGGILVTAATMSGPTMGDVAFTAADGTYSVAGLAPGSYRVQFADPTGAHLSVFYTSTGFSLDAAAATPVVIGSADVSGIDVKMPGPTAGTRLPTPITAAIRAGTSHTGTFTSGRTLVVRSGGYVTVRFSLGLGLKGQLVTVLSSTKDAAGKWKTYRTVGSRRVGADGYAYYTARVTGWRAFRARYAGDVTHKPGLSPAVAALGR